MNKSYFFVLAAYLAITCGYFYTHAVLLVSLLLLVPLYFVGFNLFGKKSYLIKFKTWHILIAILILVFSLLNGFSYNIYIHKYEMAYDLKTLLDVNKWFIYYFGLALISVCAYIFSSMAIGEFLLSKAYTKLSKVIQRSEYMFISIAIGLISIETIYFILAIFGQFNTLNSLTILFIPLILSHRSILKKAVIFFQFFQKRFELQVNFFTGIFYIFFIAFISTLTVSLIRSFIYGPDGLRLYLTTIKYLANNNAVPTTEISAIMPFFTEILFAPLFMVGKIQNTITTSYTISLLYLFGFALIARRFIDLKKNAWIILPILLFPPFVQILSGEYKIDIFLAFMSSILFLLLVLIQFNPNEKKLYYLCALILGTLPLIKITALFFVVPSAIYLTYKISKHSLSSLLIFFMFGIIPSLPWLTLYRVNIPTISNSIGLGLAPQARITPITKNPTQCSKDIVDYEQELYISGFSKNKFIGYIKLFLGYFGISGKGRNIFSMLDPGLLITTPFIFLLFTRFLPKRDGEEYVKNFKKLKPLLLICLVGFVPWALTTPVLIWYVAPIVLLCTLILYLYILKNASENYLKIVKFYTLLISSILLSAFLLLQSFSTYFLPNLTDKDLQEHLNKEEGAHKTYAQAYEIAKILNKDDKNSSIIFSSSAAFANINYYIENYFDRVMYFDTLSPNYSESDLENLIDKYSIKYLITNNISIESKMDCLGKEQKEIESLFKSKGTLIREIDAFTIYQVN